VLNVRRLRFRNARKFPAIPEPRPTVESMHDTVMALKEAVEIMTRQRGGADPVTSMVTWGDLVEKGLIEPNDVPNRGSDRR